MQVDSVETSPKEKVETKVESPTVALATEQLQELIASLQRTSKSTTTTVKTEVYKITDIQIYSCKNWHTYAQANIQAYMYAQV